MSRRGCKKIPSPKREISREKLQAQKTERRKQIHLPSLLDVLKKPSSKKKAHLKKGKK